MPSRARLDGAAERWREGTGDQMAFLSRLVGQGALNPAQFQAQMRDMVKELHVRMAVFGNDGERDGLTQRDWGIVGRECRNQYAYLNGFAQDVIQRQQLAEAGAINPQTGEPYTMYSAAYLENRAKLYAKAARATYERIRTEHSGENGDELIWTLSPAEHCATCLERDGTVARRDSIPFWPGIGTDCQVNCRCSWELVE